MTKVQHPRAGRKYTTLDEVELFNYVVIKSIICMSRMGRADSRKVKIQTCCVLYLNGQPFEYRTKWLVYGLFEKLVILFSSVYSKTGVLCLMLKCFLTKRQPLCPYVLNTLRNAKRRGRGLALHYTRA